MANTDLKLFYSIEEVAQMVGVPVSTIRFWEKSIPQLRPVTIEHGRRRYKQKEVEAVRMVYNYVKVRGYKLSSVKKMLQVNRSGTEKEGEMMALLQSVRDELIAIKNQLDQL